jgi:tryptophanase
MKMKTQIEPYRIKVVEPISFRTKEERRALLEAAGFNLFKLQADDVTIDLLTDSGTSAMSSKQWARIMEADESYAGARSYEKFEHAVNDFTGLPCVIPVHQGRAAERLLFEQLVKCGDIVPSNTHFDTTRANLERLGAIALDLPCERGATCFNGNINLEFLQNLLDDQPERVPFGMLTLTNNACAGQPVSLGNVVETARLLKSKGKPLFIDAARIAENAFFVYKEANRPVKLKSIAETVRLLLSYADGCLMSCKKDAICNTGAFIALKDELLTTTLRQAMVITEGFPTYGGLSGRDLEAVAEGLREVTDLKYLEHRFGLARDLCFELQLNSIPVVTPPAMHAVYVDARKFLDHLTADQLPGQSLACELYLEAGIRSCEIGTVMFGRSCADKGDLVRLAMPRRVYTACHYEYVAEALVNLYRRRETIGGMRFVENENAPLRHFTASFEWIKTEKLKSLESEQHDLQTTTGTSNVAATDVRDEERHRSGALSFDI